MLLTLLLFVPPAAYQVLAIAAGVRSLWNRRSSPPVKPEKSTGVSVLKPLRGLDPNTADAFLSQAEQDYPDFELLFGVRSPDDPAVPAVRALQERFPALAIDLIIAEQIETRNGKVGVLAELAHHARHSILVVNDSDIKVGPQYLRTVTAPLADPKVGVVTCPYRAVAHNVPAGWEALGIAIDFMPSALVAPLVGVREFGLGSTLAFRKCELESIGGFEAFGDYIADDYQLAKRITGLGKHSVLSSYVVETSFGDDTWRGVWQHQLRWARTIRTSKGGGYAGLPLTQAGLWITVLFLMGKRRSALILLVLRLLSAWTTGGIVLRSVVAWRFAWLAPLWDWFAFTVWTFSYFSRTVRWRDRTLQIDGQGRIR